ncbi:DUF1080 domain-containing protein [Salegentibacter sp. BLCTC]|uniref:DUF1080 domain-containing protein n=1 Tax=Salegentibacter maritimus TaxID=2794347 RepID=A0ABS0THK5_9FLAO|nr:MULTISPECIES: DUF1080 domain-containing protein [Salegentibacter]MBE7640145.1 DUF1080 domain-containing protein [Salegentibacter sp. BLCTC]MBI6120554.1 DUF1080 domain-containing protein [Salegentibacter maritimus]
MKKNILILGTLAILSTSCKSDKKDEKTQEADKTVDTTAMANNEDNWTHLFNGENLESWKAFNADSISDQWQVKDGAIAFTPAEGKRESTENLISKNSYANFELSLEWKISEAGNSGIMWGVQESEEFSEPYLTGPEIQILDNKLHPDAKNGPIRQAGALYDMMPPSEDKSRNAGEWNKTVIKINHKTNKGSVRLNGTLITEFPVHGEEWDKLVANSKFKDWEHFGKTKEGHIALQDHGDKVWFRNIKIRELD